MAARVSLCLMVKNEQDNLPSCLRSAADLVHEMIVVDTGSTDRTKEVAASLGARVLGFAWVDSFAAARNESLRHATGDWIFWLDGDEYLDEANRQKVRTLFANLGQENAAYSMKQCSAPEVAGGSATVVDQVRLFRNLPEIRWEHRVHEQILPAVRRAGHEVRFTDIAITHTGYEDPAVRHQKTLRNLRLLELELAEQPEHPFTLFNLGWACHDLGRTAEAIPLLCRSLARSQPGDSIVRKGYTLLVEPTGSSAKGARRWPPAGRGGRTVRTMRSCSFSKGCCAGSSKSRRGRRRAFGNCSSFGRVLTSPASTRGCVATRRGTSWRSCARGRGERRKRKPSGAPPSPSSRASCRRGWSWRSCTWRRGAGPSWKKRRGVSTSSAAPESKRRWCGHADIWPGASLAQPAGCWRRRARAIRRRWDHT
jgi:hypothetical protein